jgi:hypothetical protein
MRATCPPPHSPDLPNDMWEGVQNMKLLIVQLLHSPFTSSLFGLNICV